VILSDFHIFNTDDGGITLSDTIAWLDEGIARKALSAWRDFVVLVPEKGMTQEVEI
jgi:hypothetical protein